MMEHIRKLMQKYEMTETQLLSILGIGANRIAMLDIMDDNKDDASRMTEFMFDVAKMLEENYDA